MADARITVTRKAGYGHETIWERQRKRWADPQIVRQLRLRRKVGVFADVSSGFSYVVPFSRFLFFFFPPFFFYRFVPLA